MQHGKRRTIGLNVAVSQAPPRPEKTAPKAIKQSLASNAARNMGSTANPALKQVHKTARNVMIMPMNTEVVGDDSEGVLRLEPDVRHDTKRAYIEPRLVPTVRAKGS